MTFAKRNSLGVFLLVCQLIKSHRGNGWNQPFFQKHHGAANGTVQSALECLLAGKVIERERFLSDLHLLRETSKIVDHVTFGHTINHHCDWFIVNFHRSILPAARRWQCNGEHANKNENTRTAHDESLPEGNFGQRIVSETL